jgi:hypothetical protein
MERKTGELAVAGGLGRRIRRGVEGWRAHVGKTGPCHERDHKRRLPFPPFR